jgi:hypothetical protein
MRAEQPDHGDGGQAEAARCLRAFTRHMRALRPAAARMRAAHEEDGGTGLTAEESTELVAALRSLDEFTERVDALRAAEAQHTPGGCVAG